MAGKENSRDFVPPERVHLEGRQYALVPPGGELLRAVHVSRAHRTPDEGERHFPRGSGAAQDGRSGRGQPSGGEAEPDAAAGEVERLTLWRDEAMRDVQALKAEVRELRGALNEYADHQSWRCGHPDRYPWEPDCPCGLVATMEKVGIRINPGSRVTP